LPLLDWRDDVAVNSGKRRRILAVGGGTAPDPGDSSGSRAPATNAGSARGNKNSITQENKKRKLSRRRRGDSDCVTDGSSTSDTEDTTKEVKGNGQDYSSDSDSSSDSDPDSDSGSDSEDSEGKGFDVVGHSFSREQEGQLEGGEKRKRRRIPFAGAFEGFSWNSQALFASKASKQRKKTKHAIRLLRNRDFGIFQETHSTKGAALVKATPRGFRSFWAHGSRSQAGVGLVISLSFLQQFDPVKEEDWEIIVPGRAAVLRLNGFQGSLDIFAVYMTTGSDGEARDERRRIRTELRRATRDKDKVLTLTGGTGTTRHMKRRERVPISTTYGERRTRRSRKRRRRNTSNRRGCTRSRNGKQRTGTSLALRVSTDGTPTSTLRTN